MVGEGRFGFGLLSVTVHNCQNAKGRDKHREELAKLPVEFEEPHRDDVCEEGVRVPDRSDIAESVVTWKVNAYLSGIMIDTYGANDTLANQSKEGNVRPSVRRAVKRRKRVYGKGDRRVTRWLWPVGAN